MLPQGELKVSYESQAVTTSNGHAGSRTSDFNFKLSKAVATVKQTCQLITELLGHHAVEKKLEG
jgi:hypothetical protein